MLNPNMVPSEIKLFTQVHEQEILWLEEKNNSIFEGETVGVHHPLSSVLRPVNSIHTIYFWKPWGFEQDFSALKQFINLV